MSDDAPTTAGGDSPLRKPPASASAHPVGRPAALAAMVLAALSLALLSRPADAHAAYYVIVSREDTRLCLTDLTVYGDLVRLDWCNKGFRQQWEIWNGGWTRNRSTGYCLDDSWVFDVGQPISNNICELWGRMYFQHWQGGWYQRPAVDGFPAHCLKRREGDPWTVITTDCIDPGGWHHPRELWYVLPA